METKCPICGHLLDELWGRVTLSGNLLGCATTCTKCGEEYIEWFKSTDVKHIGTTVDDAIATIPHRFFYPAEGQTEESMVAAGVQKLGSVMKGN